MGYTIFQRDQITPPTTIVHGVDHDETVNNPGTPPVYPETFQELVWSDVSGLYDDDPARRVELWRDTAGTATYADIMAACPALLTGIVDQVKTIRRQALSTTVSTAGILAVYDENYTAALAVKDGSGTTRIMRNGMTATAYMAGFGQNFGMTAEQFADYIIAENRATASAYRIEQEYLRVVYSAVPACTDIDALLSLPAAFQAFCQG